MSAGCRPDSKPCSKRRTILARLSFAEEFTMRQRRFTPRQDQDGTWSVFDGPHPATFTFHGDLHGLTEVQVMSLVELLNTLELKRAARQASISRQLETFH